MFVVSSAVSAIPRVSVRQLDEDEPEERRTGTGFVVAPGKVLTALHLIDGNHLQCTRDKLLASRRQILLFFRSNDEKKTIEIAAEIDWGFFSERNAKEDWVVLRFASTPNLHVVPLIPGTLSSYFELVRWVGYGYLPHTGGMALDGDFLPTIVQGSTTRWQVRCNQTSTGRDSSLGGLSGGPCIVAGKVIAMFVEELVTAGAAVNRLNTAYALPLTVIRQSHPELWPDWQPQSVPPMPGLLPLRAMVRKESFRAYLTSEHLPYYSRKQHLESCPVTPGLFIEDEDALLGRLLHQELRGLVISGGGGYGKTRLLLELGKLMSERGCWVARVEHQLPLSTLDRLANELPPGKPALLLIDYVETQVNFDQIVGKLEELAAWGHDIRYVVSCRTSYMPIVHATVRDFHHVDLSPADDALPLAVWLSGMRDAATGHILQHAGLLADDSLLRSCGNTPVLAAFALWLKEQQRGNELQLLLHEQEFVRYVARRVGTSFVKEDRLPGSEFWGNLGILLALLPLPVQGAQFTPWQERVINILTTDGWIEVEESASTVPRFVAAHDVLVDRIFLTASQARAATLSSYMRSLLTEAARLQAVSSALAAVQRVSSVRPGHELTALDWYPLLVESLRTQPLAWREARLDLLRTHLLSPQQQACLLANERGIYTTCVADPRFHRLLGRSLGRITDGTVQVTEEQRTQLITFTRSAVTFVSDDNYLLTKALVLDTAGQQATALSWLKQHPAEPQTHYLLRQWLLLRLPEIEVWPILQDWMLRLGRHFKWSYLLPVWLGRGGSVELIRAPLVSWLSIHGESKNAWFVYRAWLKAGGEPATIAENLRAWARLHKGSYDDSLYLLWLHSGGAPDVMGDGLLAWMNAQGRGKEDQFLYERWLKVGGAPEALQEKLLAWLQDYSQERSARYLFTAWLKAGGSPEVIREPLSAWISVHGQFRHAWFVYEAWFSAGGKLSLLRKRFLKWADLYHHKRCAVVVYAAWLQAGGILADLRSALNKRVRLYQLPVSEQLRVWLQEGGDSAAVHQEVLNLLQEQRSETAFEYKLKPGGNLAAAREALEEWLETHGQEESAASVYGLWRDAGGNFELVRTPILSWIHRHSLSKQASHVYRIWLGAAAPIIDIQPFLVAWLDANTKGPSAVRLLVAIAAAPDLPRQLVQYILDWFARNDSGGRTVMNLNRLQKYLHDGEFSALLAPYCEQAIENLLTNNYVAPFAMANAEVLFHHLFASAPLQQAPYGATWQRLFLRWLRHPVSFTAAPEDSRQRESPGIINCVETLLDDGQLLLTTDEPHLHRLVQSILQWTAPGRRSIQPQVQRLMTRFPAGAVLWKKLLLG